MSPLARTLLALACAALLHASSADKAESFRAEIPGWTEKWPCAALDMGIENDPHAKKVVLNPIKVPYYEKLIFIPNAAKPDESLIGQHLHVCPVDFFARIWLHPVSQDEHSPIRVYCHPFNRCQRGVVAFPAQYVIKKLL